MSVFSPRRQCRDQQDQTEGEAAGAAHKALDCDPDRTKLSDVSPYYEIFPATILSCVDSKMFSILSRLSSAFFKVALTLTRMHIGAMAERAPMAGATKTTLELRQVGNNFLRSYAHV